jgi:predicted nucleic acid-binding protein
VLTPDALNAAVAHEMRATIITRNVRDYPMPDVSVHVL